MKKLSPKPQYKGITDRQYSAWVNVLRTMKRLDIISNLEEDDVITNTKVKPYREDIESFKEQRARAMPWLDKKKNKRFYG
jgi:hypothetical protein